MRRIARTRPARWFPLLAASILLATAASPIAAQWVRLDWKVQCGLFLVEGVLETFGETIVREWCDDENEAGMAGAARREFRAASYWMQGLGFREPIVRHTGGKNMAWIDNSSFAVRRADTATASIRAIAVDLNGAYYDDGSIRISSPALAEELATEAHELFHAVQRAHAPTTFIRHDHSDQWVWEGTARAIEQAWAAKPNVPKTAFWETRHFDEPLHQVPFAANGWTRDRRPAYGTAKFWLDVGRQLRAPDGVGYLPEILTAVERDSRSLNAVDKVLERRLPRRDGDPPGGIQRAYPEFVRFALSDPNQAERWFDHPQTIALSLRPGSPVEKNVDDVVLPVAANAYTVQVNVPPGDLAGLRIEVVEKNPNLHLIVDDRRYNRTPPPEYPDRRRNVFATTVAGDGGPERFFVRVANVSRQAVSTTRANLKLKVTLTPHFADVRGEQPLTDVLFTYIESSDIEAIDWSKLAELYADDAGLPDEVLEKIQRVMGEARADLERDRGGGEAEGQRCLAMFTLFNDDTRSFARMQYDGSGGLIDNWKTLRVTYGLNVHQGLYYEMKSMGQQMALLDDPQLFKEWGRELLSGTLPGIRELARQGAAASADGASGGGDEIGELYEGLAHFRFEPTARDGIRAYVDIIADGPLEGGPQRTVRARGTFAAIPGPLTHEYLYEGCETLPPLPEEDDDVVALLPAVYPPPGEDGEDGDSEFELPIPELDLPFPPIPPPIPCLFPPQLVPVCMCVLFPEYCTLPDVCETFPGLPHCEEDPRRSEFPDPLEPADRTVDPDGDVDRDPDPARVPDPDERAPDAEKPDHVGQPTEERRPGGFPKGEAGRDDPPSGQRGEGERDDGASGDPGSDPASRRSWSLVFPDTERANLTSEPQSVVGSGGLGNVSVSSDRFRMSMRFDPAEIKGCGFSPEVRRVFAVLDSSRSLTGALALTANPQELTLTLSSESGDVVVRGNVGLEADATGRLSGDIRAANLELRLGRERHSCDRLVDFSFGLALE